ncbi:MAG TPA: hypothetical protein DD381_05275 [Lentisphaeria bacterium]|nr:MAG: hypothetical protein A2X47_06140 [Lentisphaerae bacterium GWF2_38_69]HBM15742.1 hypothetical protein [Lentisphaeria bacterium]
MDVCGNGGNQVKTSAIVASSFLVLGNVLGVGVLALPIASGLGGFIPAILGIFAIWLVMLFSAWLIAYRMEASAHHDMPSFYNRELGTIGKWLAIICNLIILYGVLVAYVSGVTTMVAGLFPKVASYKFVVMIVYFLIGSALIAFGLKTLRKGILIVISIIWISFFIMVFSALSQFHAHLLTYTDWRYLPVCMPLAVSAFHFHNIIPTVSKSLNFNKLATCKAILLGVALGLIINAVWIILVLGSIPETGVGVDTIVYANAHSLTANVPLSHLLKSEIFTTFGLIFGIFAITSSFMTNGAGLWGFVDDMLCRYFKINDRYLVTTITFLPVIVIALIYPNIFISALSIVGGIGEAILFGVLPAIIIINISKSAQKYKAMLKCVGVYMLVLSVLVVLYVAYQKVMYFANLL